jgi:DNA-directed RNA polymerase subunit K/omega
VADIYDDMEKIRAVILEVGWSQFVEVAGLIDEMGMPRCAAAFKELVNFMQEKSAPGRPKEWTDFHKIWVWAHITRTMNRRNETMHKAIKHLIRRKPWHVALPVESQEPAEERETKFELVINSEKRAREIYHEGTRLLEQWKAEGNDEQRKFAMEVLEAAKASDSPGPIRPR